MRQSTATYGVFVSPGAHAACTWKYCACFSLRPCIWQFLPRRLGVACGVWNVGFFGDDFVRRAMLGSTLDTLSAPVLAFRRISHNFYVDVDSVRCVSLFSRRIEKVLSRCFARVLVALPTLGNLYIIPTSIRG